MFRFVNGESKTIFGGAAIVGLLSFVSRLFGLVRDRILLGHFGAGTVLDAYYAAFKLPDLIFSLLVVGSLSAGFIPFFSKYFFDAHHRERAWEFTNKALNLIAIGMAALSFILFVFAHPLAELIAPGFDPEKQALVASYTRVMLLSEFILAGSMIFGGVLQGMKRFLLFSLAPIFYNIGIIIGAVWLTPWLGAIGLGWGVVLGAFLHFAIQLYGVREAGFRYRFVWKPTDPDVVGMLKMTGPRILGIGVSQINFVLLTALASLLADGSVTILQVAYNIQFFPIGIFGIAYAIAAFPTLVEHAEQGNMHKMVESFSSAARQILFFMIPVSIVFLLLRAQVVRVVAGGSEFDWNATILAADTLAFFTLSFAVQSLNALLARAFYALHDTMSPLVAGLVSELLVFISALWFSQHFGVVGLGMAYSLGAFVNFVLLWVPLRQRTKTLDEARILRSLFTIATAGIGCFLVTQSLKPIIVSVIPLTTFWGVLSQGLLAGGAGLAVYIAVCYALRNEELRDIIAGLHRRVFKKYKPEEAIATETQTGA